MNLHAVMNGDIEAVCARAAGESEATETARQLSPELARSLARAGYFNMFVPKFGWGPIAAARSHDAAFIFGAS